MHSANPAAYLGLRKSHRSPSPLPLFLCGLLSATQIQLIGYLSIVELIFVILAPYYLVTRWHSLRRSQLWPFLVLIMGWFASAVVTDLVRGTELTLAIKGSATPLLWASAFISMYFLLRGNVNLMGWFLLGAAISGVIALYVFEPGTIVGREQMSGGEIEFNYRQSIGVTTIFVWTAVFFLYPRYRMLTLGIMVAFALLSFLEGSRSAGAIAVLAVILFVLRRALFPLSQQIRSQQLGWRAFRFAVIALIAVVAIADGYRYVVLEGWLGDVERRRYLDQRQSEIGILVSRSQFASAMFAIADSPVLGHGSWARDEVGYRFMGSQMLGMDVSRLGDTSERLIPSHSHLWGPWISHGFLGFFFWFYVLVFILRFMLNDLPYATRYLPFLLLLGLGSLWHIIFSPVSFRPVAAAGYSFLLLVSEVVARARSKEPHVRRAAALLRKTV